MYSHEIELAMKNNNYNIDSKTFMNILQTSPQIDHTRYNAYDKTYELWTRDGLYAKFTVYCIDEEKEN